MTIVEELRRDRESGAKRLESEYKAGLMTLARNFCVDESDAEELVNRTFAAVVEGIDDYLEQSAFFAWMCQILKNIHALDTRRKSHGDIIYPGQVPEIADEDAQEEIYRNLDASLVREAIKLLPPDQRETLLLHYFMDMPVAKIAKFLSIPVGTVNSRLHYARKALATKLGVKMHEMAGKPGGKAVLLALLFCGITALGAGARLAVTRLMSSPSVAVEQQADNSKASGQATSDRRQAEACGQATCDMRHAEASNLSTFQPFNLSTDNSQGENMNISKSTRAAAMLAAATVATSAAATAQIVPDGNAQVVMQDGRTVLIYNTNGTFTVTEPGTVEILAVGGGGGGGASVIGSNKGGGGGGGGGVYTNSYFGVSAGTYTVVIGSGGAAGENGGNTTLSVNSSMLVTAYGGGAGAQYGNPDSHVGYAGRDGGSGGGSSRGWTDSQLMAPGRAIYTVQGNLGHDGGQGTHPYGVGGGGGAGEAGGEGNGSAPGKGGDGVEIAILAPGFWYGGGGAGYNAFTAAAGGKGGGAKNSGGDTGRLGENGLGGGGCGGYRGGSGTLILAFTPSMTADSGFFEGEGGNEVIEIRDDSVRDEVRVFQQSGTLTLTGRGTVEVLAVGGGGGGGTLSEGGAGGGGAGGFVHYTDMAVSPGTYEIEIGAGGAVGSNGGVTRGLGVVAYGGGAGGKAGGQVGQDGASGGGASHSFSDINTTTNVGGRATKSAYANSGHDGYQSIHPWLPGGGGGAGGSGAAPSGEHPGSGGDGLSCSITGSTIWYAGGGAGYRTGAAVASPGGHGGGGSLENNGVTNPGEPNTGGGGCGGSAGGSGIFIVRYHLKPLATVMYMR